MHIIFKENLGQLPEKFIVLDLDTFMIMPAQTVHTACCLIENIPITEMGHIKNHKELHESLIKNYAQKNWNFCEQAIEQLMGKWGGEVDTFYADLRARIKQLIENPPPADWTPVIQKTQ